ncbi:MAG: NAD-dependent epimerase [Thiotrichaceae bacterium]
MKVLITGAAGFIGMHAAIVLLKRGDDVVGIDVMNDYYDVSLKEDRLKHIEKCIAETENPGTFTFKKIDMADRAAMEQLFSDEKPDGVINLAAQAGVRYSIDNPLAYVDSNLVGFAHVLEGCRHNDVKHLVYASSSSVYGANETMPFSVHDNVDHPVSLYAASKKANELMAHSYSHLYGMSTTGLRFFTVYGPWGRPDMSPIKFAKAITEGKPIDVYNYGKHQRDFTYIDDIVDGLIAVLDKPAKSDPEWNGKDPSPASSKAPWKVYNIGNNDVVELLDYIECIEKHLGMKAEMNMLPLQDGDVIATYADVDALIKDVGYKPGTDLDDGIKKFIDWYKEYYS